MKETIEKINGVLFEILMGTGLLVAIGMGLKFLYLIYKMVVTF